MIPFYIGFEYGVLFHMVRIWNNIATNHVISLGIVTTTAAPAVLILSVTTVNAFA